VHRQRPRLAIELGAVVADRRAVLTVTEAQARHEVRTEAAVGAGAHAFGFEVQAVAARASVEIARAQRAPGPEAECGGIRLRCRPFLIRTGTTGQTLLARRIPPGIGGARAGAAGIQVRVGTVVLAPFAG